MIWVGLSRDHTLRIWDVDKGTSILVGVPFEGHESCVRPVAISPDDKRIASGGDDQTIIIWDVKAWDQAEDFQSAGEAYRPGAVGLLLLRWPETC